ncbi:MAG: NAD(P)-dependent oxidoreductase, partial [Candidatus Stygibacter frigidus]|nr:NAD(P)-dependent oxidoreductase [Candidatus Stygibacter frigidus]
LGRDFEAAVNEEYNRNELMAEYISEIDQKVLNEFSCLACFSISTELDISHIKYIHSFGAGVNPFINHPKLNPAVMISRTVGLLGKKIAKYCLAYMLEDHQEITANFIRQQQKEWKQGHIRDMFNSSVAVLGTGEMGREIAELLSKIGCRVFGINSNGQQHNPFSKCFSLEEFCTAPPEIDTLISVLPSTEETQGLLNEDFFRNLSEIHLINVGRGDVIREIDVRILLSSGKCRKITLDVFEQEPLSPESDLWLNRDVIISPHQAAITDINDVMMSFRKVNLTWESQTDSHLFVDLKKGY